MGCPYVHPFLKTPHMDGRSFPPLAAGKIRLDKWSDFLLYEYYREYNYPHTPTMFALRRRIFQELKASGGAQIPLTAKCGHGVNLRKISGTKAAEFPREVMRRRDGRE